MGARHLLQSFHAWRAAGEPLVLATVYETAGSTYSKAGHRILLAANGDYRGLVSGGCLEGDLAERARGVVRAGRRPPSPTICATPPTSSGGSASVATGCCECSCSRCSRPTTISRSAPIAERLAGTRAAGVATVIESGRADLAVGATAVADAAGERVFGASDAGAALLRAASRAAMQSPAAHLTAEQGCRVLYAPLQPIPKLLVLGGGLDAIPLVSMAAELGWFVTVADHRPGLPRARRLRARRARGARRAANGSRLRCRSATSTRSSS